MHEHKESIIASLKHKSLNLKSAWETSQALIEQGMYSECAEHLNRFNNGRYTDMEIMLISMWDKKPEAIPELNNTD